MQTKIGTLKLINKPDYIAGNYEYLIPLVPIIICDDEIKENDYGYIEGSLTTRPFNKDEVEKANKMGYEKVLVLPNQFSPEFIQAIVDSGVKDGDKVEVEMEWLDIKGSILRMATSELIVKLRKDNTVIIHKISDELEELKEKARKLGYKLVKE
jgi:hypothetical protein